ncbi:antigen peptide transporter 2-like [Liasis olivaceus]
MGQRAAYNSLQRLSCLDGGAPPFPPTQTLMYTSGDALSNVGAAEKVLEYLRREPSVCTGGTLSPESLHGHVCFRNVSFCYPSRPNIQALKNVSFELCPEELRALVGLNGSGKSSCVALLEHFYESQSMEVLLDGVPVGDYGHKHLHRQHFHHCASLALGLKKQDWCATLSIRRKCNEEHYFVAVFFVPNLLHASVSSSDSSW